MNYVAQLLQKQNEPFLVWYPELEYVRLLLFKMW